MTKDEIKNRISMALKDPILQQGFEIICRENELLKCRTEGFEEQILGLLYKYESVYKRFPDLKDAMNKIESILKENAELKEANIELKKVVQQREQRWLEVQEDLLKENTELKERADKADLDSVLFFNQLCKAKEIIKNLLDVAKFYNHYRDKGAVMDIKPIYDAEQFLKEVSE